MVQLRKKRGRPRKHFERIEKEEIWCSMCKVNSIISNSNVEEIICGTCMAKMILWEEMEKKVEEKEKEKYPRGWHRRKHFEAPDGRVFSFGKEVT